MEPLTGAASAAPATQSGGGPQPSSTPSVTPGTGGVSGTPSAGQPAGGGVSQPGSAGNAIRQAAAAAGVTGQAGTGPAPFSAPAGQQSGTPAAAGQSTQTQQFDQAALQGLIQSNPGLGAFLGQINTRLQTYEQQANELRQWAQLGQQHYHQQRLAAQNPQPQPGQQQPTAAHPFNIPKFDRRVLETFVQGPNGELQPGPFSPPGAMIEYRAWDSARRQALDNFLDNPEQALGPLIEKRARELAGSVSQEAVQSHQTTAFANDYVKQNSGWLFSRHQNGQPQTDLNGRPMLSPAGQLFAQTVQSLQASGVQDVRTQQALAEQIVFGQMAIAQTNASQQAAQQSQQGRQNMLTGAAQTVPGSGPAIPGSHQPATVTPAAVGGTPGNPIRANARSIGDAFKRNAAAQGVALT